MLIQRGVRINATNRGDDIPLHLAAAHGHRNIVQLVNYFNLDQIVIHIFLFCKWVANVFFAL